MSERIDALARRVRNDDFFLASALEQYRASEQLDEAGLAATLGCDSEILATLGLCRRPREGHIQKDIDQIAKHFGLDAGVLAQIVRRADAVEALRRPAVEQSFTAAARDRPEESPENPIEDEPS
jgi:hypothetical protein